MSSLPSRNDDEEADEDDYDDGGQMVGRLEGFD
jgi:hypothetical protein